MVAAAVCYAANRATLYCDYPEQVDTQLRGAGGSGCGAEKFQRCVLWCGDSDGVNERLINATACARAPATVR